VSSVHPPGPHDDPRSVATREDVHDSAVRVLRFWRDVEVFALPTPPPVRDQSDSLRLWSLRRGDTLPWADAESMLPPRPGYVWRHSVFAGVGDASALIRIVLSVVSPQEPNPTLGDLERISGKSWLAAFSVEEHGYPLAESYVPASFALGVGRLRAGKGLDGIEDSIREATDAFRRRWPGTGLADNPVRGLGWEDLAKELAVARAPLGASSDGVEFTVMVKSVRRKRDSDTLDTSEQDIDFLNSFFVTDLDRSIGQARQRRSFGKALAAYLAEASPRYQRRIDVLADVDALLSLVSPRQLPPGRWPCPPSRQLYLGQQAAVTEALRRLTEGSGLVAINGPPGTGKSTLLQEIVANVVVDRARQIAPAQRPAQIFEPEPEIIGGVRTYPILKSSPRPGRSG
jgi:hypothetical protein